MKTIKRYIKESQNFLVNKKLKNRQDKYEYHPTTKDDLYDIIVKLLKNGQTDLNCIDVSSITDMGGLFSNVNESIIVKDIDISKWDVSNVEDMSSMFCKCRYFNSDLSKWNVSQVNDMTCMFYDCCKFNSDLSNWKVTDDCWRGAMFCRCDTLTKKNNVPKWYSN